MIMIEIVLLLLAIPAGLVISHLAKDELKSGEKWLLLLVVICVFFALIFYFAENYAASWTSGFALIVGAVSLYKSKV